MPRLPIHLLPGVSCLAVLAAVSVLHAQPHSHPKPGMPRAVRHESRLEIDQLEENWRAAILKGDDAAMDKLLSDDYIGITGSGTLQSKDDTIANLRSGATQFKQMDLSDRKVRFYSGTAVVTSRAEVGGTTASGNITGSYRYTRVYVRDAKGDWKIVSFEASRIRDPEDKK